MDNDAERLAHMQRVIHRQLEEIERLQRRPVWVPAVGALALFVAGSGLPELVRYLA
jgi:hypothetical protein